MRIIFFALCFMLAALSCSASVLIIHEKRFGDDWALDVTWLDDASEIGEAMVDIDTDPNKRRGPSNVVLGGVRVNVEPIETPGTETWEADESQAGSFVVFWNVANSNDPADWHAETFPDQVAAETFINEVKADPARELWDERPLKIDRTWQAIPGEPLVRWVLVP